MNKAQKQTLLSSWLRVSSKRDGPDASQAAKRKLDEVGGGEKDDSTTTTGDGREVDDESDARPEKHPVSAPTAPPRPPTREGTDGKGATARAEAEEKENLPDPSAAAELEEKEGDVARPREEGEEAKTTSAPAPFPPDEEEPDDDGLTAYERERELLIARNREALAALGVASAARALSSAADKAHKKQRRGSGGAPAAAARRAERAAASAALREEGAARRSSLRPRRGAASAPSSLAAGVAPAAPRPRTPTPEPETYDNRVVLNYMVDRDDDGAASAPPTRGDDRNGGGDAPPSSLRRLPLVLAGPVVRAYSVSASPCGSLLAAGGKDGWAAIWGARGLRGDGGAAGDGDEGGERPPLLSARLHRSWIADVALASRRDPGLAPLLLTAANDGTVAVHDSGEAAEGAGRGGSSAGAPRRVADASPHGGAGIFSMAVLEGEANHLDVATASKDGSVAVSRVVGGGKVENLTTIDDAHGGSVVKCVRWRDGSCLASCGNDGAARLWDVRCPFGGGGGGAASVSIPAATVGGVAANVLRWRERAADRDHLLVAGTSPEALVFDVRNPSAPLLTLRPPPATGGRATSSSSVIYQPCYVGRGHRAIAVGLPRSRVVSLFDSESGAPLSRGDVGGHDASTLQSVTASGGEKGGGEVVCAVGTRCLHLFEAV